ncbi:hypothetical protein PPBDW_I22150 [Photobacterium kishitanii]|nr:hypothetical protein PPBDW_I22150 [Photobacterium kishitanii]
MVIFSTLAGTEKMKMTVFYLLMAVIGNNNHQTDMFSSFLLWLCYYL